MIEILRLQQECLDRIKNHVKCGSACCGVLKNIDGSEGLRL